MGDGRTFRCRPGVLSKPRIVRRVRILTPQAARQAAEIIAKLRDTYAAFRESNPELFDLAVIGLAGYALHQFGGFTADVGLLVSYAVVKKEKLSDIFSSWKRKE